MHAVLRLKTGFYRTSAYRMEFCPSGLRLAPDDPQDAEILLPAQDIQSVTLREKKQPHLEIVCKSGIYEGSFPTAEDSKVALRLLKQNLGAKVVCVLH